MTDDAENEVMTPAEVRAMWQELIDDGVLVPTGEMRPGRDGKL
jgi:hypothetical protein